MNNKDDVLVLKDRQDESKNRLFDSVNNQLSAKNPDELHLAGVRTLCAIKDIEKLKAKINEAKHSAYESDKTQIDEVFSQNDDHVNRLMFNKSKEKKNNEISR